MYYSSVYLNTTSDEMVNAILYHTHVCTIYNDVY